jgi:Tol biopolymer transport system component
MVCSGFDGRARIGLLLFCAAVIPSCGGGNSSGAAPPSKLNTNPSVSQDGRFVVFESSSSADRQVVIVDRVNATSAAVGTNEDVRNTVVTPDGRFIAFDARPAGSGTRQVFLRNVTTGITTLVSATADGVAGSRDSTNPSFSDDGRFIAFESTAVDLGAKSASSRSILVRDESLGTIQPATASAAVDDANPSVSGNGQFVAFESRPLGGSALTAVVLWNRLNGQVTPVSQGEAAPPLNGSSTAPSLSFDGRFVAFESRATNLTPPSPGTSAFAGESNVLVRDVLTGTLAAASVSLTPGKAANGDSHHPSISGDGGRVTFDSTATNLTADSVPAGSSNVFLRDLSTETTRLVTPPTTTPTVPHTPTTTGTPATPPSSTPSGLTTSTPVAPIGTAGGLITGVPVPSPTSAAGTPTVTPTATPPATAATSGVAAIPTPGVARGLTTSTPVPSTGTASGLVTGTPVPSTTPTVSGLPTSSPVPSTTPVLSGLPTSTPVPQIGTTSGLPTSTPVPATGTVSGLTTSTPVPPMGTASGLVTSTPVGAMGSTATGAGITAVLASVPSGSEHPRISSDGAWIVFESEDRVFLADLGTGEISEINGGISSVSLRTGK